MVNPFFLLFSFYIRKLFIFFHIAETCQFFIEKQICEKIDEIIGLLLNAFIEFDTVQMGDKYEHDDSGLWINSFRIIQEKVPPIRNELEDYFREIVSGITKLKTKNNI